MTFSYIICISNIRTGCDEWHHLVRTTGSHFRHQLRVGSVAHVAIFRQLYGIHATVSGYVLSFTHNSPIYYECVCKDLLLCLQPRTFSDRQSDMMTLSRSSNGENVAHHSLLTFIIVVGE